ncbi:MAG TPA: hypothetical protein VN696_02995 [Pyrinomonadaceae bacterium]|nr:hypothetical protein [Pyrinomonadaceae bacterium]
MSHKFKVKGLSGVQLKSDGTEIVLEFKTAQREKLVVVVPGYESRQIAYQMMQFDRQAQIKREIPPDADRPTVDYAAPPYIFVTAPNGLQCVVRPDSGALDLQVQDIHGHEVQISLAPHHVKALFDALLQTQKLSDDEKSN